MTKTEKDKARAELDHALAALSDGSGHEQWGPGAVMNALYFRRGLPGCYAADALGQAGACLPAMVPAYRRERPDALPRPVVERFIRDLRKLAPVMLEILLEGEE